MDIFTEKELFIFISLMLKIHQYQENVHWDQRELGQVGWDKIPKISFGSPPAPHMPLSKILRFLKYLSLKRCLSSNIFLQKTVFPQISFSKRLFFLKYLSFFLQISFYHFFAAPASSQQRLRPRYFVTPDNSIMTRAGQAGIAGNVRETEADVELSSKQSQPPKRSNCPS